MLKASYAGRFGVFTELSTRVFAFKEGHPKTQFNVAKISLVTAVAEVTVLNRHANCDHVVVWCQLSEASNKKGECETSSDVEKLYVSTLAFTWNSWILSLTPWQYLARREMKPAKTMRT
jgi:hypothetical protein